MKRIKLQEGFKLNLVASEPIINEPVVIEWDANGRLYVVEMNTYMQDIDGKNQRDATSRVVRFEDTNGDGNYDKHTVFIDGLVLPRMLLTTTKDKVIVRETDTFDLYSYEDTDGDGKADKKELVFKGGRRGGNLEHQPSGMRWNIDNWMYVTYSNRRYRMQPNGMIEAEQIAVGTGQWGIAYDEMGQLIFSTAGGERVAHHFQIMPQYGSLSLSGEMEPGFEVPFPITATPDVQGGLRRIKPDGTLNKFTGCCGPSVFLGDNGPSDMYGDYIVCEPVGRLIRRAKMTKVGGKNVLSNAYPGSEFIASSDMNFRPVNSATGPDGALYICDMYRGIIQEGNWVRPGSYLRPVVEKYKLQDNIRRGRIYRVVHESYRKTKQPRMYDEKTADLVRHLSHANGWWRMTAQKELILRQDDSVVSALKNLAKTGEGIGRVHAMWTLEGLGQTDAEFALSLLKDKDHRVRQTAIRLLEPSFQSGDDSHLAKVAELMVDKNPRVVAQAINSVQFLRSPDANDQILAGMLANENNDFVQGVGRLALNAKKGGRGSRNSSSLTAAGLRSFKKGRDIYNSLCVACHGKDGKGTPIEGTGTMAPSLVGSPRLVGSHDAAIRIVLHGLTGPVNGKEYIQQMIPMKSNGDDWIADVLTYSRNSFGNNAPEIKAGLVKSMRETTKDRVNPYTIQDLAEFLPVDKRQMKRWGYSASHGGHSAKRAADGRIDSRFSTDGQQRPGMTFTVDMKEPRNIYRIVLDTTGSARDYPRGYEVAVSNDGEKWSAPVVKGKGTHAITSIAFDAVNARYFRITQTGSVNGLHWSIHEMSVFEKGGKVAEVAKVQPKEKKPKPRPANLDPKNPYHLVATDETLVIRSYVADGPARGISVGMPNGISYCFDAEKSHVVFGWFGVFMDVGPDRGNGRGRGGRPNRTLGTRFSVGAGGFPIRIGEKKPSEVQFRGYRRAKKEDVSFRYDVDGVSVQQKISPAKAGVGLAYQFTIEDAQSDVTFTVDREQVNAKATKGKWNGNDLKLTLAEAKSFTVEVMQKYN